MRVSIVYPECTVTRSVYDCDAVVTCQCIIAKRIAVPWGGKCKSFMCNASASCLWLRLKSSIFESCERLIATEVINKFNRLII